MNCLKNILNLYGMSGEGVGGGVINFLCRGGMDLLEQPIIFLSHIYLNIGHSLGNEQ